MTEDTRQSLEDEYLFTNDYPAIHAALNQGRTLVACIDRVSTRDRTEVCMVAINPDGLIEFSNGYVRLSHAANNEKDFTTACRSMNVGFFQPTETMIYEPLPTPAYRRFAKFCMWLGAITLAIILAAFLIATLAAFNADLPLFR